MMSIQKEGDSPDVGRASGTTTLRDKINVLAITTPYGTQVIGSMISELGEMASV